MNINKALITLIVILILAFTIKTINTSSYTFREIEYTVARGETLWSIAEDYCPEDMDIREYIDRLHISPDIYEGQTIIILEEVK